MNLSKKLQILFILLACQLITLNAQAQGKENFYMGLSVVDSFHHFYLKAKNASSQMSVTKEKEHSAILGNAFLGYGYTANCSFYIAAELGTNFPKRSTNIKRSGVTIASLSFMAVDRLTVQDYLMGDLLLGYRLSDDFLFYFRGGLSFANIKIHQFADALENTPVFDADKNKIGGRVGAGINYAFGQHFGLGFDYIFTHYQPVEVYWSQFDILFTEKNYVNCISLSAIYSF